MKHFALPRIAPLLSLCLGLTGCAAVNQATMQVLSTPAPALVVVGERVLSGMVTLYTDRSATLEAATQEGPPLSCMGAMRYTSTSSGVLNLRCSDGVQAQLPYVALTQVSGYGSGRADALAVSFTYGLEPEAARAWLIPLPGKRLVPSGNGLKLE